MGFFPVLNENYIQEALLSVKLSVAVPRTRAGTAGLVLYNTYSLLEDKEDVSGLLQPGCLQSSVGTMPLSALPWLLTSDGMTGEKSHELCNRENGAN